MNERERMLDLRKWLRSSGCCPMCSLRLAIVIVEKEHGREASLPCSCGNNGRCDAIARQAWSTRPQGAS
jgi:hypothetical protein